MPETSTEPNEFVTKAHEAIDDTFVAQADQTPQLETEKRDTDGIEGPASLTAQLSTGNEGGTIENPVISNQKVVEAEPVKQPVVETPPTEAKLDAVMDPDATPFNDQPEATTDSPASLETTIDDRGKNLDPTTGSL